MTNLLIVIATFNERQTLPDLVQQIWKHVPEAQILVVDDNSPDGTGQWVRQEQQANPQLQLLHREHKQGLGAATIAGLKQALTYDCQWIATMDADFSHRPIDLQKLYAAAQANTHDVIVGSRYITSGRIENWSWRRRAMSRGVNRLVRWRLRLPVNDCSGAFRIYRKATLQALDLQQIDLPGFVYLEQILLHLHQQQATFCEVPIVFSERELGSSKINVRSLMANMIDLFRLLKRRR